MSDAATHRVLLARYAIQKPTTSSAMMLVKATASTISRKSISVPSDLTNQSIDTHDGRGHEYYARENSQAGQAEHDAARGRLGRVRNECRHSCREDWKQRAQPLQLFFDRLRRHAVSIILRDEAAEAAGGV